MKALIYAVRTGTEWQWLPSIDLDLVSDIQHWSAHPGDQVEAVRLDPVFSYGQAYCICKQLNEHQAVPGNIKEVNENIQRCAARLGWSQSWSEATFAVSGTKAPEIGRSLSGQPPAPIGGNLDANLAGRSLLLEEFQSLCDTAGDRRTLLERLRWLQGAFLRGQIQLLPGLQARMTRKHVMAGSKTEYSCERCGASGAELYWTDCQFCGEACPYCESCLTMGKTRFCSLLICGREAQPQAEERYVKPPPTRAFIEHWGLSDAQAAASSEGLRFLSEQQVRSPMAAAEPGCFLIWAVTGAGKTEMMFPLIDYQLQAGGRVLIATPRKDVVLELKPRLQKAFSRNSLVTLYGGSEQRWETGDITLATTHQLLRFSGAFDLVVIDEIDAFPFHNNPMLEYAARKACRAAGKYIFLSATPPAALRKSASSGRLPHVKVPARYHRHPLPVPQLLILPPLKKVLAAARLPHKLMYALSGSVDRGAQLFFFVPRILLVQPLVELMRSYFPELAVEGTSSKDAERTDKVLQFRQGGIRILVTTTILERGVTVPKTDVFIADAGDKLFDEAALIQMSGRAGRSKEDPAGRVFFWAEEKTRSQAGAIKQIKLMNRIAKKRGYLDKLQ